MGVSVDFLSMKKKNPPAVHRLPIHILKELLLTYTEEDASEAKTYAEELIVMVVSDPSSFVFDDVLNLAPVKMLENQPIHNVCWY